MDVYTPVGDGPWPVVVAFHGFDGFGKDEEATTVVAEAAAAQGMVVFVGSWIVWEPPPFPFSLDLFEGWKETASCAVAYAQEHAAEYGGNPASTVVYGFSGGAGIALLAAVQPSPEPVPGCETGASPDLATGVVLGDGPYFLHDEGFDDAFDADTEGMQAEVAGLVDPTMWPTDLDAEFFLWIPTSETASRPVGDSSDESGWLVQRDPDGSIRADLGHLNQLDDGRISNSDAARLLELRLSTGGFEVTLDEYPGGHTTLDKVPELVGYLKEAASK